MTTKTKTLISGEWLLSPVIIDGTVSDYTYERAYEAERVEYADTGFPAPFVTRAVAERIVADQHEMDPEGSSGTTFQWDGDTLVVTSYHGDPAVIDDEHRVEPDADGLYEVGFGWVWDVHLSDVEAEHTDEVIQSDGTPRMYRIETRLADGTVVDVIATAVDRYERDRLVREMEAERAADTMGAIVGQIVITAARA